MAKVIKFTSKFNFNTIIFCLKLNTTFLVCYNLTTWLVNPIVCERVNYDDVTCWYDMFTCQNWKKMLQKKLNFQIFNFDTKFSFFSSNFDIQFFCFKSISFFPTLFSFWWRGISFFFFVPNQISLFPIWN